MKNILLNLFFVFTFLSPFSVLAKEGSKQPYKGDIVITPVAFQERGDSLYMKVIFKLNGVNIDSQCSVDFVPVIVSSSSNMILPSLSVKGHRNYLRYRRTMALMKRGDRPAGPFSLPLIAIKGFHGNSETVTYEYSVPFEAWMSDAQLVMQNSSHCEKTFTVFSVQTLVEKFSVNNDIVKKTDQN